VNLGPTINSAANDHCPYIPPDGHHLIFVSSRAGTNDFYIARRHDNQNDFGWQAPANIAVINSTFNDQTPWAFEDDTTGNFTFYFSSSRPGGPGLLDIYASPVTPDWSFGQPALVPELSTGANDLFPVVRRDGLEMFLTSNRVGTLGGLDIWVSTRSSTSDPWPAPVNLGPVINTEFNELRFAVSWDGTSAIFFSDRPGGSSGFDLLQSTRTKVTGNSNP
jgi:hypothetical protein